MSCFSLREQLERLPLILAGPILRRTEPTAVTVWLVLRQASTVTLKIYATQEHGSTICQQILEGSSSTVAVGAYLHVVAVTAVPFNRDRLKPGFLYAYDLDIQAESQASSQSLSQALTSDLIPIAAISYFAHQLPTFSLSPADISQLKIVHGSCRKAHGKGYDTLPIVDELILQNADSPDDRPHQLFFTGDQIYGDDVADPFLGALTSVGEALLGWKEPLPISSPTALSDVALTPEQLKPGQRNHVVEAEAGFTAGIHNKPECANSHLLGFSEYVAAYAYVWSPVLWSITTFPDGQSLGLAKKVAKQWNNQVQELKRFAETLWKVRRSLANIPVYMIFDDHDISDDWNLNQAWCLRVLGKPLGRRAVQNGMLAYAIFQAWGNTPEQFQPGKPGAELLKATEQWSASEGTDQPAWNAIARYLGMPPQDPMTGLPHLETDGDCFVLDHDPCALTWNYTVHGTCHEVIVLDTRTWRGFPIHDKATAPPKLLCPSAFDHQLKHPLAETSDAASNVELTLIVAPTNLFSLWCIDLIQHYNLRQHKVYQNDVGDAWNIHKAALARFVAYLFEQRRQVVVLSGDIHYGSAVRLEYWETPSLQDSHPETERSPYILVQLTSSAIKNSEGKTKIVHTKIKSLVPERDRTWVGWNNPPTLQELPQPTWLPWNWQNQHQLSKSPEPDWRYRIHWIERQPAQTPYWGEKAAWLPPTSSPSKRPKWLSMLYRWIQSLWNNRWVQDGSEVVGLNNIGLVHFEDFLHHPEKRVVQDLYWYAPWKRDRIVFSRFRASLGEHQPIHSTPTKSKRFTSLSHSR